MVRPLARVLSVLFAVALLAGSAGTTAAYEVRGTGLFARFAGGSPEGTGIFMVDRAGSSNPRLHGTFVGLLPYIEQDAVFRSIGCNGTPSAGNRVFRVHGIADQNGDLTYDRVLSSSIDFGKVRSVWIDIDKTPVCAITFNYSKVDLSAGDFDGDAALGLIGDNGNSVIALAEKRPNGRARLSIVVNGMGGNDQLNVRFVNKACGTTGKSLVQFKDVLVSSFRTKTVDMTQGQLDSLRSVRVASVSTANRWCAPLSILIAMLFP